MELNKKFLLHLLDQKKPKQNKQVQTKQKVINENEVKCILGKNTPSIKTTTAGAVKEKTICSDELVPLEFLLSFTGLELMSVELKE